MLKAQFDDYQQKTAALAESRAEVRIRRVDKDKALKTLKASMRADLVPDRHVADGGTGSPSATVSAVL